MKNPVTDAKDAIYINATNSIENKCSILSMIPRIVQIVYNEYSTSNNSKCYQNQHDYLPPFAFFMYIISQVKVEVKCYFNIKTQPSSPHSSGNNAYGLRFQNHSYYKLDYATLGRLALPILLFCVDLYQIVAI